MGFVYPPAGNKPDYTFEELTDVDFPSTPVDKQLIRYNGTTQQWENVSGNISSLANVNAPNPSNGQYLRWDNATSKWVNANLQDIALNDLSDVAGSPNNGDMLSYNSGTTSWAPVAPKDALTELTDTAISSVKLDQVLTYVGSAQWANGEVRTHAPALYPAATTRYYFPQAHPYVDNIGSIDYQYINGVLAIRFGQDVTVNKWAIAYNNNGTIAAGNTGLRVRGFIYQAGTSGRPNTLVKDLGGITIVASDDTGGQTDDVVETTLASSVNLSQGVIYYVGIACQPVNAAGHTNSAGPDLLVDTQANYQPFLNNGILPTAFTSNSFGFRNGAYFISGLAATQQSGNVLTASLPDNIENTGVGGYPYAARIGLHVSALL